MKIAGFILGLFFILINLFGAKPNAPLNLSFIKWDAYVLGITDSERLNFIKKSIRRPVKLALVSAIGGVNYDTLNRSLSKDSSIEFMNGAISDKENNHDTYQMSEVIQIANYLGISLQIKVYTATTIPEIGNALKLAGENADLVIFYSSFWGNSNADILASGIKANPKILYIAPYGEVKGAPPTGTSLQARAARADGSGLSNFITVIPFAQKAKGKIMRPSQRNAADSETINFIAPSSYASNAGTTCPSVGVTAVVSAYIISAAPNRLSAVEIVDLMRKNVTFDRGRLLKLAEFTPSSLNETEAAIKQLSQIDTTGIRRLDASGLLDLWQISQAIKFIAE